MKKEMMTMDGNMAAAYVAYAFTEVAAIYPITPSSTMAEYVDEWSAFGRKNIFGNKVKVAEMQSEGGAAGAMHGSLQAGALTTSFTASQGLLLMIPNMYKISGELLPGVLHVSARALSAHALSIFGDHADIYSTRQTGFCMLASGSVQEIMDISGIAHLTSLKGRLPFLHFFDGFRSSHEIQKIETIPYEELAKLVDQNALQRFRASALNPEHPVTRGLAQNPDIYFQAREAANSFYDAIPDMVEDYMQQIKAITGREYHPFDYYGAPDAERVIVAMGSVTETIKETIDFLAKQGEKVGVVCVHLYRPFSLDYFFRAMPKCVKKVAVLDRTKEPGAGGEPLYLDVKSAFYGQANAPIVVGGRYGLSSKDTTPAQIVSVFDNLKQDAPKDHFTLGIVDDVTMTSLPLLPEIASAPEGTVECKFYGLGSDGTVGANKNSIKIIGDNTDMYAQAYFAYDSKKSGGLTVSHLRFGKSPIRSTYLVKQADFVACSVPAYIEQYDMLTGLKPGGTFLLNSIWSAEETTSRMPNSMKRYMAENDIQFYIINATEIGEKIGLGNRTNSIMQSAFFYLSKVIDYTQAVDYMKYAIKKTYGKKGDDIVNMNCTAVDAGKDGLVKVTVDPAWKNLPADATVAMPGVPAFITEVVKPISAQKGDLLPVSTFKGREDGTFPNGTAAFEKRGIAVHVPEWIPENCIQCNQCAIVCPHAVIRPFLATDEEKSKAPEGMVFVEAKGIKDAKLNFRIQISPYDCTGCGNCVQVCPAKDKALALKSFDSQKAKSAQWQWMIENVSYKSEYFNVKTVKGSQFRQPLFEFSGACGGCGETPYVKAITQLFGDRMLVANATGCSSIYGGSAPATPYCVNAKGQGPAWASSLFEDNAEFGYGMTLAVSKQREALTDMVKAYLDAAPAASKAAMQAWLEAMHDGEASKDASDKLIAALTADGSAEAKAILELKDHFIKKSIWAFGGDGWAYDIGYGGLDHVLACGEDINVLVMDTEVYSNTGGQSSKSTPTAAVAKFAASGKKIRKKDLGLMAVSYGYVYVAQVALGANQSQFMKALAEAEAYDGPSLIIAYSPCINHGIRSGMGTTQLEQKKAVDCGYWQLYRYDPRLEAEGKNPFQLDSAEPDFGKFQDFIGGEVRYTSLKRSFPETAGELFKAAEDNAKWRYGTYKRLAGQKFGE